MNTIVFNNGFDLSFNIDKVIQENDIQNIILAYNYTYVPVPSYSITDISSIDLTSTIYEIGINAFYNFTSMKEITLSTTVNKINLEAFYNCTSLQSIILPDALSFLGSNAFYGCSSLSNVVLNNTINLICVGESVFIGVSPTGTYTFGLYNNIETPIIYK